MLPASAAAGVRIFDKDLVEIDFEKLLDQPVDSDAFVDPVEIALAVPAEPLGRHVDDREMPIVPAIRRDMSNDNGRGRAPRALPRRGSERDSSAVLLAGVYA